MPSLRLTHPRPWILALIAACYFAAAPAAPAGAETGLSAAVLTQAVVADAVEDRCGEKVLPAKYYTRASQYALIGALAFLLLAILADNKKVKIGMGSLAVIPVAVWLYVHFFVDFDKVKRITFTYNTAAEATLANIAEAQDRYKSEHDTFLSDLNKLYSHTAGAGGMNACVKIVSIEAEWNRWSATARHVSSPETVTWDSSTGSSLKKG